MTKKGAYTFPPLCQPRVPYTHSNALPLGSWVQGRKGRSCRESCQECRLHPAWPTCRRSEPGAGAASPLPGAGELGSLGSSAPALGPHARALLCHRPGAACEQTRVKDTAPTGEAPAVPNPDSHRQAERISQIPQSGSTGSKLDAHQHRQQWDTASTVITTRSSLERCGDCHEALTPTMHPKSTQMSLFFHSPGWM